MELEITKAQLELAKIRVRTGPGKPGSPGILLWHFPGLESPGPGCLKAG